MRQDKTARWLDLIAFLLHHRFPVTREQIYEGVGGYRGDREAGADAESLRRKFERDKDELRALGVDIETLELRHTADESGTGYRLQQASFYLPYLELRGTGTTGSRTYPGVPRIEVTAEQVQVLQRALTRLAEREEFPLARAAKSAILKLTFDEPVPVQSVERVLAAPLTRDAEKGLEVLQLAVQNRNTVTCEYYSIRRDTREEREIEPYGLFFNWGQWYLVGRARDRDFTAVFRVNRMRRVKLVRGKGAAAEVPDGFSIREYVGRSPWELSSNVPQTVRVRFAFPESRWVQAKELGTTVDEMTEDGSAELEFAVRDRGPFLRWLLTFQGRAEVLAPADVADSLGKLRADVARLYQRSAEAK